MRSKLIRKEVYDQCVWALSRGLEHSRPGVDIDDKGYVGSIADNLLPDIHLSDFEQDLRAGAGSELDGKFLAAHSSCALAVNCFALFRQGIPSFDLGRHRGLGLVGFEQKFPIGLARATPPHVDVLATGSAGVVAIESKCIEYLSTKPAKFSKRYETDIVDERSSGPWFAEMLRLMKGGRGYRLLDAAQLIKHSFGLARQPKEVALVYLYWEPIDSDLSPLFAQHREEIAAFAAKVAGGRPSFEAMTYNELWEDWASSGNPDVSKHVRNLRSRYEVPAWAWEGVSWVDGRIINAGLLDD
jgi:hypothetical protein